MKNKLNICLTAAIVAVLLSAINCNNTPTSPGKMILMNYPKGGEIFSNGDRVIIQWTATGGIENVDIVLFANFNDYGEILTQNIPAEAGQFIWTIQTCLPYNQSFIIEITDSASLAARTTSLGFTIKQCLKKMTK